MGHKNKQKSLSAAASVKQNVLSIDILSAHNHPPTVMMLAACSRYMDWPQQATCQSVTQPSFGP